jgi:hypothetical protein
MEGTIVGFSDSGPQARAFAVVEVVEKHTVIVPVSLVQVIGPEC